MPAPNDEFPVSQPEQLRARTKQFAVRVVHLFRSLPRTAEAKVLGKQLLRSATSVAANYRAACRGRSKQEFAAKIGLVLEEADESVFWIEMLVATEIVKEERVGNLLDEANQLTSIFAASKETLRKRMKTIAR